MSETGALAQISQARRFLEQAKDLTDIRAVRDMADAARLYARARHLGLETENAAAEVKVRADRKLGEVLSESEKQKPGQYQQRCAEVTVAIPPTLAELGLTKRESSDAQAVAALPESDFEQIISATKEAGKSLTTKPIATEGRKRKKAKSNASMSRSRTAPRTPAEKASPVNTQNIHDARLRSAFSRALASISEISVLSPSRVLEVLSVADANRAEDAIERLGIWLDSFREARAAASPRLIGGGRA